MELLDRPTPLTGDVNHVGH